MPNARKTQRSRSGRKGKYPRYRKPRTDINDAVHSFKRCLTIANLTSSSTSFSFTYALSDLPAYTEFTPLWDQYRITGVKLTFLPSTNSAEVGTSSIPRLYIEDDYDGSGPTTAANFLERGVRPKLVRDTITHYSKPRVAKEIYSSAITTGYSTGKSGLWLDLADPAIEHNGTYCLLENATAGWTCTVIATFYIGFKGVK